ncbi:hypothetical protein [Bacillus thuringiensis]|nr:hypothetical protein [Bacillus thuringiensis]
MLVAVGQSLYCIPIVDGGCILLSGILEVILEKNEDYWNRIRNLMINM